MAPPLLRSGLTSSHVDVVLVFVVLILLCYVAGHICSVNYDWDGTYDVPLRRSIDWTAEVDATGFRVSAGSGVFDPADIWLNSRAKSFVSI